MAKKLKDSTVTLKVFGLGEISGTISDEQYDRLIAINEAYADQFENAKEPEPLFVKAVPKTEVKNKSKKDDIQA